MLSVLLFVIGLGGASPAGPGPYLEDRPQSELRREATLAHDATVIGFDAGDASLTPAAQGVLRALVAAARAAGPLHVAHVAAWSDESFAEALAARFPDAGRKLAAERAQRAADYLADDLGVQSVTTYNAADGTTRLERAFDTADAELKDILGGERSPQRGQRVELRIFRDIGRPGAAVVVIEHGRAPGAPTN